MDNADKRTDKGHPQRNEGAAFYATQHGVNYFDKTERIPRRIRNSRKEERHGGECRHGAGGVHIRPVVCPYPQQSKRRPKPQHVHNMDKYRQFRQTPHIEEVTSPRPIWTTWTTESRHARRCVCPYSPRYVSISSTAAPDE